MRSTNELSYSQVQFTDDILNILFRFYSCQNSKHEQQLKLLMWKGKIYIWYSYMIWYASVWISRHWGLFECLLLVFKNNL